MMRDYPQRSSSMDGAPGREPVDTFEAAIAEVAELTLALTSATAMLAFADGGRIRGDLERKLSRAQALAEHIPDRSARAEALRQLGEMHGITTQALMIAPAPSFAAIEAAEAGDPTPLRLEELEWIAGRVATGSSPSRPRRQRSNTRLDSPQALRNIPDTTRNATGATCEPAIALNTPDKAEME